MRAAVLPRRIGQQFRYRVLDALVSITGDKEDARSPRAFKSWRRHFYDALNDAVATYMPSILR